jgi:thiol:disulfide interchange protein DsbD
MNDVANLSMNQMRSMLSIPKPFAALLLFFVMLFAGRAASAADFLDPASAFTLRAELGSGRQVRLEWEIAKGYKLYRESVTVSAEGSADALGAPVMPKGIAVKDPTTGEQVEIYHDRLVVPVPLGESDKPFTMQVAYQGCAEDGLCYPPVITSFRVDPSRPGALSGASAGATGDEGASAGLAPAPAPPAPAATPVPVAPSGDEQSLVESTLQAGSLWKIVLAFLGFGLLLSFTPCILPMVPILSSIIVGDGNSSRSRAFLMGLAYCTGLSLVYTALGIFAGLAGEGLAGFLQQPAVLLSFALLLLLMSLSMFDVYQLQMPVAIQNRLNQASGKLKGGSIVRVFVMGALSALVVGPCVAAPLAGTLVYISQTKDVVLGGLALFSMAVGMSVPLLLVALSAGSLLPKAGAWMVGVKHLFGIMLIAVAIWMATPVLPLRMTMLAWGLLCMAGASLLGLFDQLSESGHSAGRRFSKAFAIALLVFGVLEFTGAAIGGGNLIEPLAGLRGSSGVPVEPAGSPRFITVRSEAELDAAVNGSDKPVLLDFSAAWCVSCKELDEFTFSDPDVARRMEGFRLVRADVTANSDAERALMKRFGLFGPPAIVFFDKDGREIRAERVVGFIKAADFSKRLDRVLSGTH